MTQSPRATALLPFVILIGCATQGSAQPASPTTLPLVREWHETNSGVEQKQRLAITDPQQWHRVWASTYARRVPPPPLPEVDFSRHMVLAVFMGQRMTGGYDIRITRVARTDGELIVSVQESAPRRGAVTFQALTQPFHIVVVPKVQGKVTFTDETGVR